MKREKSIKELKIERPRRAVVSEKEALRRMKDFSKRKQQFLATANNRVARESAKLDNAQEQTLAAEAKEWVEY